MAPFPRASPRGRRGRDVASLIELTNRQKTENSVVFADSDWKKPSLVAVIDYHTVARDADDGDADWGRHPPAFRYDFPFSDEWDVWQKFDGVAMDQAKFAEFVEERLPDMVTLVEAENAHHARELQVAGSARRWRFSNSRAARDQRRRQVRQNVKLQSWRGQDQL